MAEARIEIDATRLLCLLAADRMDKAGNKAAKAEIAMIKVKAPRMALKVIDDAIQAHGGAGVSQDTPLAASWAGIRTLRLADGPDEVHNRSIALIEFAKHAEAIGNRPARRLFDLTGKVAIVTGSSRGIGLAIAAALAEHGAKIVISSRKQDACDEVAHAINAQHGDERAIAVAANISSKDDLQNLVDETRKAFGRIDVLVCNAASNPYYGPMAGISDDQFRKILDNNVIANHWLISMVAPEMLEREEGSIIIVSSIGGLTSSTMIGAYNISKAADFQLARNLAAEFGPKGVRVNCIAPGLVKTDFARALWENPDTLKAVTRSTPLRRIGEPHEIAGAAVYLASPASTFMTGQTMIVDGGSTIGVGCEFPCERGGVQWSRRGVSLRGDEVMAASRQDRDRHRRRLRHRQGDGRAVPQGRRDGGRRRPPRHRFRMRRRRRGAGRGAGRPYGARPWRARHLLRQCRHFRRIRQHFRAGCGRLGRDLAGQPDRAVPGDQICARRR